MKGREPVNEVFIDVDVRDGVDRERAVLVGREEGCKRFHHRRRVKTCCIRVPGLHEIDERLRICRRFAALLVLDSSLAPCFLFPVEVVFWGCFELLSNRPLAVESAKNKESLWIVYICIDRIHCSTAVYAFCMECPNFVHNIAIIRQINILVLLSTLNFRIYSVPSGIKPF